MEKDNQALTEVKASTGEVVITNFYLPTNPSENEIDLDDLENLKPSFVRTPEIYNFEVVGTKIRGIYLGMNYLQMQKEDGTAENKIGAFWKSKIEGQPKLFCNLGKQFVSTFLNAPQGMPFEAELVEIKKMGGGKSFKKYQITELR